MALRPPSSQPYAPPGSAGAVLSGDALNRLLKRVARLESFSVGPGLYSSDGPAGRTIGALSPPSRFRPCQITSTIANEPGRYNAKSITIKINTNASSGLLLSDLGTLASSEDTIVWNLREIAHADSSHGHAINLNDPAQTTVWGIPTNASDQTAQKPIVLCGADSTGLIRVSLSQTGGDQTVGYRYTVNILGTSVAIGTNLSPEYRPFPLSGGSSGLYLSGTAATLGIAYYNAGGTCVLYSADEQWQIGPC